MTIKTTLSRCAVAVGLAFAFTAAQADATNPRPYNPGPGNLDALQDVFNDIGATSINVYTDQEDAAIFNPTGAGSSSGAFVASISWGFAETVGLYKFGSPSVDVTLFTAAMSPGDRVGINFSATGTVTTFNFDTLAIIDSQAGFGTDFGFFFSSNSGDPVWYSEDSLNTFGRNTNLVQQLIYAGEGDLVNVPGGPTGALSDTGHYYVAFEGRHNDGEFAFGQGSIDFNDVVIQMESITPVPEPETYAMLLAGLGLMGFVARRRQRSLAVA